MTIENVNYITAGVELSQAKKVLVMLHGRGDMAQNFIGLSSELDLNDFAIFAIQAEGRTWYPYSFMAPVKMNEPFLTNSLAVIKSLVDHIQENGFKSEQIYFMGFSQGACLTLEFVTRHAQRFGGAVAFTGGLIGEELNLENYKGDFEGMPVFIGSSDHDPHVPEVRIDESEKLMKEYGADVNKIIYPGMGHTINMDEVEHAKNILNN